MCLPHHDVRTGAHQACFSELDCLHGCWPQDQVDAYLQQDVAGQLARVDEALGVSQQKQEECRKQLGVRTVPLNARRQLACAELTLQSCLSTIAAACVVQELEAGITRHQEAIRGSEDIRAQVRLLQ